jgi:hypothetical protein
VVYLGEAWLQVSVHQGGGLFFGGAEEAAVGAVVALAGGALVAFGDAVGAEGVGVGGRPVPGE